MVLVLKLVKEVSKIATSKQQQIVYYYEMCAISVFLNEYFNYILYTYIFYILLV